MTATLEQLKQRAAEQVRIANAGYGELVAAIAGGAAMDPDALEAAVESYGRNLSVFVADVEAARRQRQADRERLYSRVSELRRRLEIAEINAEQERRHLPRRVDELAADAMRAASAHALKNGATNWDAADEGHRAGETARKNLTAELNQRIENTLAYIRAELQSAEAAANA